MKFTFPSPLYPLVIETNIGTFIKKISVYSLVTFFTMLSLLLKFEDVF